MSSRPDFMPKEYIEYLSSVQDGVPSLPGPEIREIITKSIRDAHDLEFDDVFDSFDYMPLGSASIGQVHQASLTKEFMKKVKELPPKYKYSGGSSVAVKVMHFDAEDRFRNDLRIFKMLCRVALPGWGVIIEEFERQIMTEFDYLREARNLRTIRQNIASSPYRHHVVIPDAIESFSTGNVLIMEMIRGKKLAEAAEYKLSRILGGDDTLANAILKERRKGVCY